MNVSSLKHLFLFLIVPTLLMAAPNPVGSIGGTLLDQETKTPLDHVTVFVYQNEKTTPVKVVNTDEKGIFIFSDMLPGEYRIEAGFLGYLSFEEVVQVLANQQTNLGDIALKADAKILKAIEVTGLRSTMKLEVDKKVFTVDQTIAAAGASTSDILKNIPSVDVDAEGSISLRNSSNVIIWINGKPSGLTSDNRAQVLEQMPAESIDRIEVVTNPSAKFSAEGSAGIINIILKKDRKAGYYGSLRAGGNYPWGYQLGGNINYSSPKWDLYGTVGYRKNTQSGTGTTDRTTFGGTEENPTFDYMQSQTERTGGHNGLFMRGGADYHFNDKHTLGLSGFFMNGSRTHSSSIGYSFLDNDRLMYQTRDRLSTSTGNMTNGEVSLDYQWEIGEEHNLHGIFTVGKRNFPDEAEYSQTERNAAGDIINTSYQKEIGTGGNRELEFQLDYVKKFSERWKIETGWKSSISERISDDQIYNGIYNSGDWMVPTDPFLSNLFNYDEQIHAAYATLTGKLTQKLGYQLGLRAENTNISFTSTDGQTSSATPVDKNYLQLFPTFFMNYQLAEGSDLQFNYSRRINRPRGRALNPFVNISDSTNIWIGNPDLDPEYSNSLELNYLKTWQGHTLSAALYHRMNEQVIQDIRYLDGGIMHQSPENVTNSTSSGLELVAKDNLFRILENTSTLNLYHTTMDGFTYRNIPYEGNSGFSWNFRLNGQVLLPKNFMVQFAGFYSAPRIVAQGEMKAAYSFDLGVRKSFFDRKLQVALNGQNLLNSFKFENKTWGSGFYQETSNQFFSRSIRLNVTWNFGNLKPKKEMNRNNQQESGGEMDSEF